ncbi:MAG: FHA domain-containing protein [Flavobacteriales bacterium]
MSKRLHIRIGRGSKNHVVIDHEGVAEEHLELFADADGNVFISDLGSAEGTYVNGQALKGYVLLAEGDRVTLGKDCPLNWKKFKSVPAPAQEKEQKRPIVSEQKLVPKPSVHSKPLTPSPGLNRKKPVTAPSNEKTSSKGKESPKKGNSKGLLHAPWHHLFLIYGLIALFTFLIYITN